MSKSALDTLTAQYTDSENEDNFEPDENLDSQSSQVIIIKPASRPPTPKRSVAREKKTKKHSKKSVRRLVSYQDDTIISDDDEKEESTSSSEESDETDKDTISPSNKQNAEKEEVEVMDLDGESAESIKEAKDSTKADKIDKYAHYGFSLPQEPKSKPSPELVDKIRILYEKMDTQNMDLNRIIQERKEFRNPSIYEKLIQFCDINEFGTNYPPEIYDPLRWGPESYYEELARVQKDEMVKRQKKRKDNDKIEQATALARKVEEEAKKRKSKWDQPAPIKPLVPPTLTTTVTGTKGTVISAFGSLPKKSGM